MRRFLLAIGMILLSTIMNAQFALTGEFRFRPEYRDGYSELKTKDVDASLLMAQRTRINSDYKKDWLEVRFSFQDTRLWGSDNQVSSTGMFGNTSSQSFYEAWVDMSFATYSSIRIGRQALDFDDSRILSRRNWNNNGLSYDALKYRYLNKGWQLDIALSYNNFQTNVFGNEFPGDRLRTLNFIRLNRQFTPSFSASVIGLATGVMKSAQSETIYIKGTYGTNLVFRIENFNIFGSFYYQTGKHRDGMHVSAWNLNSKATYKLGNWELSAGISMISGNDAEDTKLNSFDLFYGARHGYYGHMDYFSNLQPVTDNGGLNDIFTSLRCKISPKTSLYLDYHYFMLNREVMDPHPTSPISTLDKPLGSEIDLGFIANINDIVSLRGGYSFMVPTETLKLLQTSTTETEFSSWIWLMLTVKPTFFVSN